MGTVYVGFPRGLSGYVFRVNWVYHVMFLADVPAFVDHLPISWSNVFLFTLDFNEDVCYSITYNLYSLNSFQIGFKCIS